MKLTWTEIMDIMQNNDKPILALAHSRYEKVRKLNPRQAAQLWSKWTEPGWDERLDELP